MGDSRFARCLQGGGVYVNGGSVTIDSCTITGNTALYVRAHAPNFPSPRWEIADVLEPILARTTAADDPVNNSRYVQQRSAIFPSPQWETHMFHALCLQGGGVAVMGGTVTISSCTISGNTAGVVRAHPQKFPMPPWEHC
jgi:hypothetical protein